MEGVGDLLGLLIECTQFLSSWLLTCFTSIINWSIRMSLKKVLCVLYQRCCWSWSWCLWSTVSHNTHNCYYLKYLNNQAGDYLVYFFQSKLEQITELLMWGYYYIHSMTLALELALELIRLISLVHIG